MRIHLCVLAAIIILTVAATGCFDADVNDEYDATAGETFTQSSASGDYAVATASGTLDWDHDYELRISTESGSAIEFSASWSQSYSYYL